MGLQGVTRPVRAPGRLPAPGGLGLESWCHPGELHLVAEQGAPNPALFVLSPAKAAVGVDPGPPEPLALTAAAGGAQFGGGVAHLFVRGPLLEQVQQVPAALGGLAQCGGHDLDLVGRELALVEGLGQERILGRRGGRGQATLGRAARGA